ncbi:hypothetical protein M413DRAFT_447003 [Hebeloma cylindrosporum]|uniref:F-box domain-containing protein n=1 Tax=Hebeloma cylindrosporum TaxID=76867 RepID=A0A0C3C7E1_HEBCY|nr:hypothetical protein M413DRAFT_447003 [Hebeloma cylindrosporum h7]
MSGTGTGGEDDPHRRRQDPELRTKAAAGRSYNPHLVLLQAPSSSSSRRLYFPIDSPPTPAPSPRPLLGVPLPTQGQAQVEPMSTTTTTISNQLLTDFTSSSSPQTRRQFLAALLQVCTPDELLFLSHTIAPLLKRDFLFALPPELGLHVLGFIDDPKTLIRASLVSKWWYRMVRDESVWRRMCFVHGFGEGDRDRNKHRHKEKRDQPFSAILREDAEGLSGLSSPPTDSSSSVSKVFSYRRHFKISYIIRLNWRHGGKLLNSQIITPVVPAPSRPITAEANPDDALPSTVTSFALDKSWLVVGLANSSIKVFSAHSGVLARTLVGHESGVWGVCLVGKGGWREGGEMVKEEFVEAGGSSSNNERRERRKQKERQREKEKTDGETTPRAAAMESGTAATVSVVVDPDSRKARRRRDTGDKDDRKSRKTMTTPNEPLVVGHIRVEASDRVADEASSSSPHQAASASAGASSSKGSTSSTIRPRRTSSSPTTPKKPRKYPSAINDHEFKDLSILHPVESGLAGETFPILSAGVSSASASSSVAGFGFAAAAASGSATAATVTPTTPKKPRKYPSAVHDRDHGHEFRDLSILHPVESGLAGETVPILSAGVSSAPASASASSVAGFGSATAAIPTPTAAVADDSEEGHSRNRHDTHHHQRHHRRSRRNSTVNQTGSTNARNSESTNRRPDHVDPNSSAHHHHHQHQQHQRGSAAGTSSKGDGMHVMPGQSLAHLLPPALRVALGLPAVPGGGALGDDGSEGSSGSEEEEQEVEEAEDEDFPGYRRRRRRSRQDSSRRRRQEAPLSAAGVGYDAAEDAGKKGGDDDDGSNMTNASRGWGQPNALVVSGGCDKVLRVWEVKSGQCIYVLHGHTATIRAIRLLPNRPIAITGSRDSTLRVWDVQLGLCLRVLEGHTSSVRCLDVSGNRVVSGSYDSTCRVWDVDTGECVWVLRGHFHQIYSVAFLGGRIASGGLDTSVRVWDAETGQCIALLQGHAALVCQLQLSNDLLVTGGSDGRVITFSLNTYKPLHRIAAHDSSVTSLQFDCRSSSSIRNATDSTSGNGDSDINNGGVGNSGDFLVTSGNDGRVKLWDLSTGLWIRDLTDVSTSVWKVGCVWGQGCVAVMCRREGKTVVEVWSMRPRGRERERGVEKERERERGKERDRERDRDREKGKEVVRNV